MINVQKINIFLTGVTGFVGRSVFYELLRLYATEKYEGKITLLIRNKSGRVNERLDDLLTDEFLPEYLKDFPTENLLSFVEYIEGDITDDDLNSKLETKISKTDKVYIIHSAGSTNLFSTKEAEKVIFQSNYIGTQNLLKAFSEYHFKFIFISTVASRGICMESVIPNEIVNIPDKSFRNHYEKYKNMAEKEVYEYCLNKKIEFQILRPSTICGRLIDAPLYYTSKFDMFYGCAKFFYNLSRWKLSNDKVRLHANTSAGLNIIPVDYVAKVITKVFLTDITELNIVHTKSVPHLDYIPKILDTVGYHNYEITDETPLNLNKTESLYYGLIGSVYTPYVLAPNFEYDTHLLRNVIHEVDEPDVQNKMNNIMEFAVNEWNRKSSISR